MSQMDSTSRDVDTSVDYYAVLGVPMDAEAGVIRKAYQRKALTLHPDKQQGSGPDKAAAIAEFHRVQTAYELLSDPEARAALDTVLGARHRQQKRRATMDSKRKKLQEDLERREAKAAKSKVRIVVVVVVVVVVVLLTLGLVQDVERAEALLRRHLDRIRADNLRRMERSARDAAPLEARLQQHVLKRGRSAHDVTDGERAQTKRSARSAMVKPHSEQYSSLEAYERVVFARLLGK